MRWRRWRRGYKRRGRLWRRWTAGRRIRRTRRYQRRGAVRRRRRRGYRRRKTVATFWNPSATKRCTITGWMIGLTETATSQIPQRMISFNVTAPPKTRRLVFRGGGVSLNVFSLAFLWEQHQLFHNFWSASNDGFDLARYFSTTIYLPPHKDNTYIFWWDTDFNNIQRQDFWKTHPALLLAWKNKRIIRPQREGNYRTKRVKIKPPATVSNQWRFQGSWMTMGLFMWGVTLIDFNMPFAYRAIDNPLGIIQVSAREIWGQSQQYKKIFYANWADNGHNNWVMFKSYSSAPSLESNVDFTGFTRLNEADDLPYWMTMWGNNYNYNFDDVSDQNLQGQTLACIYWYDLREGDLESGLWPKTQRKQYLLNANGMYQIACSGAFVQRQNATDVNIPLLYKSKWQWGGATLNKQAIQPMIHFAPNQVAVRNPATIQRSIITPWDCDNHGILTDEAIQRFLRPSEEVDGRRPVPFQADIEEDAPYTSSTEEVSETEEDEEGKEDEQELARTLKRLRTRIRREQHERHRLRKFFYSLINPKAE